MPEQAGSFAAHARTTAVSLARTEPGAGNGSPNVNMTLFNFEGQALPSIGIFENPAGVCERANPGSSPCVVGG